MAVDLSTIDMQSLIVTCISVFSVVYTVIGMNKAGVTVFLLQIQTPIGMIKRMLRLGGGRQDFLVGKTALLADAVLDKLIEKGFSWDYFALYNDGELISVRRLYGKRQIHVRTFEDGEIRMHDEINSDFDPIGHLRSVPVPVNQASIDEVISALNGVKTA